MSPSIKISVHFSPGNCGHKVLRKGKKPKHAKPTRLPRISRLMALSIRYERLIEQGLVTRHIELADLAGIGRSQASQIIRLRLLAPDIQEWLLNLPETVKAEDPVVWSDIQPLTRIISWKEQHQHLEPLLASKGISPPQADGLTCGNNRGNKRPIERGEI